VSPAQNQQIIESAPSKSALIKATGIALLAALLLLFTVVLPAEYAFDPLRTGSILGLAGIAKAGEIKSPTGAKPAPVQTGVYTPQTKTYKVDSEDFTLRPNEGVEMKYHMQKGAGMVYAWKPMASWHSNFTANPIKSRTRITTRATNSTTRSAGIPPTVPSPRRQPAFTAGSGKTRAKGKSPSI
jgi:hypothetical protein